MPSGGAHRKPTGNVWKHVQISVKPTLWDIMSKAYIVSGKKLSRFCIEIALGYEGIPPVCDIAKEEKPFSKSLCVTEEEWRKLTDKADRCMMSRSQFFVNSVIDCIKK